MNRQAAERLLLKAVRAYTFNTPITRGRDRAYTAALRFCRTLPDRLIGKTKDGRKFSIHLVTGMQTSVYFLGEYEKAFTDIVTSLLRPGDTCIDAGANFGWYTSLFHKVCGEKGEVHAFEPMPPTFAELEQNYDLMGSPPNVVINNLALGSEAGELVINLFEGLPTGHASLSDHGRDDAVSFICRVVTLDSYMQERSVRNVDFVKVDIEGAELMLLRGAGRLFTQRTPPIFLMEMALEQTRNFGYVPNDLIRFLGERADYDFFRIDGIKTRLARIEGFEKDDIGANVICFPRNASEDRTRSLEQYL
jgi:FkbM family methyltransferase